VHEESERVLGLLAVSTAAHIFVFVALGFAPSPSEALLNLNLEFEVVETQELDPAEEEPESAKEVEELEETAPKPAKHVQSKSVEPPSEEPPEPEEPQPPGKEAPIDFPGLTLTSEDGVGSWSTVVGTGESFKGPVVAPRKKSKTAALGSGNGSGKGGGKLSRVVKKDLSRPPVPPENMDQTLVRNYPLLAKKQGIEGTAVMRAQITTTGQVATVTLIRETFDGFGRACEKTIRSGQWRPKLDKRGRAIASDITYTCRFEVGY
jgi:TonB family protein